MGECVCVCVCVSVCVRCVHLRVMGMGLWWMRVGGASYFSQNAAIVPKIEQCRATTLIFQSIHYLLYSYSSLSHKEKNQC